jgi:hypothetical protein
MAQRPQLSLKVVERGQSVLIRLKEVGHPDREFSMSAREAMTLMVGLQAMQRKYRWPIPLKRFSV